MKHQRDENKEPGRSSDRDNDSPSPRKADGDYEVGYGRPPERTRYPKGVSGNPGGRKPGVKNFRTFLKQALNQTVTVKIDGRNRRMSVRQAIAHRLVASCAANDLKALAMLLPLIAQSESADEQVTRVHSQDDDAVLKKLRDHFQLRKGSNDEA